MTQAAGTMDEQDDDLGVVAGDTVAGKYKLVKQLGRGGMGSVTPGSTAPRRAT
ncbi:MAG: hypothetical protein HY744_10815 [Deltaproteobacteria bacterium]|nr:hypothetical protein [Deltaproteobacteria bacterium]